MTAGQTEAPPSRRRCWTQRCSRRLECPLARLTPAKRNQTAACCPDGTNTGPRWAAGTAASQRTQSAKIGYSS